MDSNTHIPLSLDSAGQPSTPKSNPEELVSPTAPKLPEPSFDASFDLDHDIIEDLDPETKSKIEKRASNVLLLARENERLNEELREMTARLEAAEQRSRALLERQEARRRDPPKN